MFTTTPAILEFIHRDPLRLKYATAGFFWQSHRFDGYIDDRMRELRIPVQLFLAGRDTIIDNQGVREVMERGGKDKLEVVTYEDQTHSIQLDAPERMVTDMLEWLRRHR